MPHFLQKEHEKCLGMSWVMHSFLVQSHINTWLLPSSSYISPHITMTITPWNYPSQPPYSTVFVSDSMIQDQKQNISTCRWCLQIHFSPACCISNFWPEDWPHQCNLDLRQVPAHPPAVRTTCHHLPPFQDNMIMMMTTSQTRYNFKPIIFWNWN